MTQKNPVLSVIMPVFNGAKFLRESIESVLNQSHRDFEFIIIDDGSTDISPSILENFARNDARLRHLVQSNQGIGATKKTGVDLARGRYVAFIDQDDLAYPERFAIQLDFLDQHPEAACVGSYYDIIDEKGRKLDVGSPPPDHQTLYVENMIEGLNLLCNSLVMAETQAILTAGNFDQRFAPADDYDLYLRIGRKRKIMNVSQVLGAYRVHAGNHSLVGATRMEFHRWEACIRERWAQGLTGVPRKFPPFSIRQLQWQFPVHFALSGGRWTIALEFSLNQIIRSPLERTGWKYLLLAILGNTLSLMKWAGISNSRIVAIYSKITTRL